MKLPALQPPTIHIETMKYQASIPQGAEAPLCTPTCKPGSAKQRLNWGISNVLVPPTTTE